MDNNKSNTIYTYIQYINKLKLNIEKTKMLPFMNARILKDILEILKLKL